MNATSNAYPAQLTIDYPDRALDRLSTGLRILFAIPILVVIGAIGGGFGGDSTAGSDEGFQIAAGGAGVLFFPALLMIVFRQKYPRWWYDWNLEFMRFGTRVAAYMALMTDRYPSTDEEQDVHVDFVYPDVPRDLNRWMPLVKWLLAIPHFIVLFFLGVAAFVVVIIAWFAILFTGRYPAGLFQFVAGVMRWGLRVSAYAFLLVTDRYPPFSLE